jgi:hypothetical protein
VERNEAVLGFIGMRTSGWGSALETRTRCEEPLGGQLEKWTTFTYYEGSRKALPHNYLAETIRTDIGRNGAFIVSACRITWWSSLLGRVFPGFVFYGNRDLIEIHIRKP